MKVIEENSKKSKNKNSNSLYLESFITNGYSQMKDKIIGKNRIEEINERGSTYLLIY